MTDITLSTGRAVAFDLYKMTVREWDRLLDPAQPREEERAILAKVCGLTLEELEELPYPDLIRIQNAFLERAKDPLAGEAV